MSESAPPTGTTKEVIISMIAGLASLIPGGRIRLVDEVQTWHIVAASVLVGVCLLTCLVMFRRVRKVKASTETIVATVICGTCILMTLIGVLSLFSIAGRA